MPLSHILQRVKCRPEVPALDRLSAAGFPRPPKLPTQSLHPQNCPMTGARPPCPAPSSYLHHFTASFLEPFITQPENHPAPPQNICCCWAVRTSGFSPPKPPGPCLTHIHPLGRHQAALLSLLQAHSQPQRHLKWEPWKKGAQLPLRERDGVRGWMGEGAPSKMEYWGTGAQLPCKRRRSGYRGLAPLQKRRCRGPGVQL